MSRSSEQKVREAAIPLLKKEQEKRGYLSKESIAEVARGLGVTVGYIYGVATFYSFLATVPRGRNVIWICKSLPCELKNYRMLVEALGKELGIIPGETTADGRFSIELTNCIGACDKAPAMMINNIRYDELTSEKISQILSQYV